MDTDTPRAVMDVHSLCASLGIDDSVLKDIRYVGRHLGNRVPALVDDFYEWLSASPEFARFFANDFALLARVKSHQTAYWRDFLRAEVNDDYVERRRVVGLAHARIELGLLIYLRAMEFVSVWLVRAVQARDALTTECPSAAFSLRKLIHFDSAIVVHAYATRTAELIEQQRGQLHRVADVMRAVTRGDLRRTLEPGEGGDILSDSVNEMVERLRGISREMRSIARGDYSTNVVPRSSADELGVSLQEMTLALRDAADKNEEHLWTNVTLADLGRAMSGNPTAQELGQAVIACLCRAIHAQVGTLYVLDDISGDLHLAGTYATAGKGGAPQALILGEGLAGQAATEKLRLIVEDVPDDCIRIRWGWGEALPRNVLAMPLIHEGEVRGVVEVGSLGRFLQKHVELLDRAAPGIALAISAAETRARLQQLLKESQMQTEELAAQQEELRSVNDTLEHQTRALELQKESLLSTETVLRHKASELERAGRYKSEFLANMSHELRTPLNSLLILARLLKDNKGGNLTPEQVNYASSIHSAGADLLTLINDILDLSKIEAGKLDLQNDAVDVRALANDLRQRFEPLTVERTLDLVVAIEPGCPACIQTDRQRLQQILTNLLSNALKFTEQGSVCLRIECKSSTRLAFTVEDTGIGIPKDQHDLIFEAFRQADGAINRRFAGTGLGLSICRELAALLGGEMQMHSTPGEGSAFTLLLPLGPSISLDPFVPPLRGLVRSKARDAPSDSESLPTVEDDRAALSEPSRVVLIVEDDPVFARILRDIARKLDFQCVVAGTVGEGLLLAQKYPPAAIVLDIGLPDHSGLSLLEQLKRDAGTRHVPVHIVSVHDHQHLARQLGAVGYLLKPAEPEALVATFQALEERLSRRVRQVLVVEDDMVQRDALVQLLSSGDVVVVGASTAAEALDALHSQTIDCVVVDLMLPDIDGLELLELMSADESCSFPPVIVYTARQLSLDEEHRLRRYSKSIILKSARSPERLVEEVTLFLHQVESELPPSQQRMLRLARDRDTVLYGRRILLVEDDVRNVFALTSMLESTGVLLDVARNGKEALHRLGREPLVDLVLMDVMMPEMDGLTAIREIRGNREHPMASLPIISLTAKAMPDDRVQCLAAGANDYIAKPFEFETLLSLLRVWMPR